MADRPQGNPATGDDMADGPQDTAAGDGPRPARASGEGRAKPSAREARLKAALQANIARRKARKLPPPAEPPRGAGDTGARAAPDRGEPDGAPPHFPQDHPGAPAPHDPSEKD